jgi:hypothetical protein
MRPGQMAILAAVVGIVIGLLLGLAIKRGGGGELGPVTRSMLIVLHPKGGAGECEAVFPKIPGRVRRGDKFVWEFINTCGAQRNVTISPKTETDAENLFEQRWPYAVMVPNDNANSPAQSGTLTIKAGAAYNHTYGYNITVVDGKTYDPKLEVDP